VTSTPMVSYSVTNISPQEFVQLPNPPLLIDVRSGIEYASSHAPTALNLSLPRIILGRIPMFRSWVLPEWFRELSSDQAIAIICLTAHRSPIAASQLVKVGWKKVYNITGGMVEWQRLNLEVCK
jgi:rhodanese-related sulfurtransferase